MILLRFALYMYIYIVFMSKCRKIWNFSTFSVKFSNILNPPMGARCSMWTGGWTDCHHEPNIHSLEMCELPDIAHYVIKRKIFIRHRLTIYGIEEALLENEVTIVVKCYDVVSPNPHCWKSDIKKCNLVEMFFRI